MPEIVTDPKSSMLLDFRRGAQGVSPSRRHRLCAAVCSFGSDGQGARKQTSLHTAETAMPPFPLQSPISKGQWYN